VSVLSYFTHDLFARKIMVNLKIFIIPISKISDYSVSFKIQRGAENAGHEIAGHAKAKQKTSSDAANV